MKFLYITILLFLLFSNALQTPTAGIKSTAPQKFLYPNVLQWKGKPHPPPYSARLISGMSSSDLSSMPRRRTGVGGGGVDGAVTTGVGTAVGTGIVGIGVCCAVTYGVHGSGVASCLFFRFPLWLFFWFLFSIFWFRFWFGLLF